MKARISFWLLSVVLVLGTFAAHADVLNTGVAQIDDSFTAYVSASNSTLGTQFLSCTLGVQNCSGGTAVLTPGQNYFIHVVAVNDCCAAGFGATFSLSGGLDVFQNAGTSLSTSTDTGDWLATDALTIGASWQVPTLASVLVTGEPEPPYVTPPGLIWSSGPHAGGYIYNNPALWNGQCENCQVDFSTEILAPAAAPEPSSLMLLGSGLIGLAELVRRRVRR